ncbi:hypothetical protein E1262_02510 [Jiangella aurantiaca]|uniref:Uncharacterized protein n=1 Tax=Jiangella aurantiaca TaxID=2530373 RepID=A0A4R5AJC1_9ACTN|nr:hypothetical protein [Jiangella aurantiaca]TDD72743.1 hypothetical protein E1262_02510 [Jiangella aurantiaca]
MSRFRRVRDAVTRAGAIGGIIGHLVGSGQAPPPADMPDYLTKQYKIHTELQLNKRARDIKRLTSTTNRPVAALDPRDAKRLRGGK